MLNIYILKIDGKDASDFLNRMTSNDVTKLEVKTFQHNCLINPQGRLIAMFPLLKVDENEFHLLLSDNLCDSIAEYLKKYIMRSAVSIQTISTITCCLLSVQQGGDNALQEHPWGLSFDWGKDIGVVQLIKDDTEPQSQVKLESQLLKNNYPIITADNTSNFLALRAIDEYWQSKAISHNKGCYPGQEIVARTTNLSKQRYEVTLETNEPQSNETVLYTTTLEGISYYQVSRKLGN